MIRDAVKEGIARVHTQVPARVLEYDHDTQRAKVQLIIEHAYDDDGEVKYYKPKPLVNVPVKFAILTWPLSPGDTGHVEFWERSGDEYLATGNDNTRPRDLRRFDLSDAVFTPGSFRGDADVADDAAVLSFDEIHLGSSNPDDFLALAKLVKAELDKIWSEIRGHTHGGVSSGASSTLPAVTGSADDVNSEKIKAE